MTIYKDHTATIEQRVNDLLARMTLEEKVGQMNQLVGVEHFRANIGSISEEDLLTDTTHAIYPGMVPEDLEELTRRGLVGSFLHVRTLEEANRLQSLAMQSRLAIPLLFGIDAIHGNAYCYGNTVYPTNIGLACTFDPELAATIARQTAREMRAMNLQWTFNPNVEIARDPRWGRCGETYGEDPLLVRLFGEASVRGYQGNLDSPDDVLACVKHFVGGSQPVNGTNGAPFDCSERTLRELFFPPFEAGIRAGAATVMMSHNEVNGIPAHTSRRLMTGVLRGEWDFNGFIVSDWNDIEHVHDLHHTATDNTDAFRQAILAGIDMHMHGPEWTPAVVGLVRNGKISEERIDESVRRILTAKFRLGLFEHPYADESATMTVRLNDTHRQTALDAARRSIVLLKNDGGLLPLARGAYRRILVTGINADDENIMGDWSESQPRENLTTILDGIRTADPEAEVTFVDQGWDPRNMDPSAVDKAVEAALDADICIVAAGEYMMRRRWNDRTCGEDTDRSDIGLVGLQDELIRRIAATGKPVVLVLVNGRPLGIEWAADHIPAIIEAWEPGMTGGQAIAELIYGDYAPSGRLAITIPRSVGQVLSTYNHKPSAYFHPVAVTPSTPLWHFGHGLTYTEFSYSDLRITPATAPVGSDIRVTVDVTNTGTRTATETVQLYLRDDVAQVTRPVKELKRFSHVTLRPGEKSTVGFTLHPADMSYLDENLTPVTDPGSFTVMAGPSSEDSKLLKAKFILE